MVVALATLMASLVTLTPTPALAVGNDNVNAISDGLRSLSDALSGLDGLDELADQIPFTDLVPTGADALDLVDSLAEAVKNALPAVPAFPDIAALNTWLNDNVNTGAGGHALGSGVKAYVEMAASDSPYGVTIDVLKFEYTGTTPIDFQEGEVTLEGGTLDTSFSLVIADTGNPITLLLDTSLPTSALYIDGSEHTMTAGFTISAELSSTGFAARLGILDVTVGGTNAAGPDLEVTAGFTIRILDPDGDGRITLDEWASTAPVDLFDVAYTSSSATTALELTSTLNGLAGAPGGAATIAINDADLSNGLQVDPGDITLNLLSDFTNMSAQDVLATIRQLAISLTSMQIRAGNLNLPFTNSSLAEVVKVNDKILQFFQDIGLSTSANPLDFTIPDEFLEANGLTTVEAILDALAETITGNAMSTASDLGITFDPTGRVLTWNIQLVDETYNAPTPGPGEKTLGLDFADQLASAGVLGIEVGASASISVAPSYSVDLTVGLDLRDDATLAAALGADPILTDRVFLDTTGVEFSASAPVEANLELAGTIGILEVALADSNGAGAVTLIGPRTGDTDPMLQIDVDGGTDNRVSLKDLFAALQADITLTAYEAGAVEPKDRGFRLFLDKTDDAQDVSVLALFNAAVPGFTLDATASIGTTNLAGATIGVTWADLLAAESPQITTGGNFNTDFLSFDIDPGNPLAMFNQIIDLLDGVLGIVDGLLLDSSVLNEPLPLVDMSAKDVVGFLSDLRDETNALVSDPAGTLSRLTSDLESQVLDAIGIPAVPDVPSPFDYIKKGGSVVPPDDPEGVFDLAGFNADWATFETALGGWQTDIEALLGAGGTFPTVPDPDDFSDATLGFQLVDFLDALQSFAADLLVWVTEKSGFLDLEYVPAAGATPAALVIRLAIGICSTDQSDAACTVKRDLPAPAFNFNLEDYLPTSDFGGLVAAEGSGEFTVSYKAVADLGLGIELPTVTPGATAGDLPSVSGSITPFLLDDSGITLEADAGLETNFSARIGPFTVAAGDPGPATPEADGECAMGDDTDDDLDGYINDGCPTEGSPDAVPEDQSTQCDNDSDDEDNDLGTDGIQKDGYVNDGCDAQGNPVVAKVGASFTVANDTTNPGTADRIYDFSAYASGITPTLATSDAADCGEGAKAACAVLPLYLDLSGGPEFLGEINFSIESFDDPTPSLTGVDAIATALADKAETLAWELIKQGLLELQSFLDETTDASNYGESIPVIGDALDAGVEVANLFNTRILTPVNSTLIPLLESYDEAGEVTGGLRDFFWDQLYADSPSDTILLAQDASGDPNGIGDPPSGSPSVDDFVTVVATCDTGGGEAPCADDDSAIDIVDVQVQFAIGQTAAATTPPFDFGFPGLRLASENPLTASVGWRVDVGFGLSFKDGFYLVTGDGGYIGDLAGTGFPGRDAEATISSSIDLPDAMEGDLAFLQVDITQKDPEDVDDAGAMTLKEAANDADPGSRDEAEASLDFAIDITGGGSDGRAGLTELVGGADSLGFSPSLNGGIDLLVGLATTVNIPDLDKGSIPTLLAVLDVQWGFTGTIEGGLDAGDLSASVDDVRLDLGSFISDFLAPVLGEVQRYTKPLQPVIDTVSAPIPGITELAALVGEPPVTLLSLFEAIGDNDLTMIRRIIDLISFVNSIPTNPGKIIIDLGEFDIDTTLLREPELPANQKAMLVKDPAPAVGDVMDALAGSSAPGVTAGFKSQLSAARTGGGFTFPAFQDPTQLFGLLMGDNPTLIRWDAGLLEASMSFSQTFGPIAVGPIPVSLVVSGAAGIQGRFAIGYDTKGIRQMVEVLTDGDDSNNGFFTTFGLLFAGVFIDDLDAAGNDVPEITLFGELAAGAAVDLVIISAGVEGGVRLTIDMNLHDGGFENPPDPENLDGKLRIDEIVTFISNPLCLFDVSGKIEAFIRVFVKIDLFLFSKTFRKTIVNIVLLNLEDITADLCAPPEPVLADNDNGTLVLNMGPRASDRNFAEGEIDEKFVVRQLGPGKVSVAAFGYYEEHPKEGEPAITKVFGDAGDGNDVVVMEAGAVPQVDGNGVVVKDAGGNPVNDIIPFTIPVVVCGGPDDDRLAGGDGPDTLVGDGAEAPGYTCTTADAATDGADEIGGLGGGDHLYGTGDDDVITGDAGNDIIRGGTGNDQISGGFDKDTMYGGSGNDATDQAFIDLDADNRSDDDEILGGPEPDPGATDAADDVAYGGLGIDSIEGDVGDDELHGGPGSDVITGDAGDDDIFGDEDPDVLFGNEGGDTIEGGEGDDDVFGNDGPDVLYGDDAAGTVTGNDDMIGGEGNDEMHGGPGYDVMLGDEGTINRNPGAAPPFTPNAPDTPLVELDGTAAGNDDMYGDADPDKMWGQGGNDDMFGGDADDEMHGNQGADNMSGNDGGDTMFGDAGTDTMYGDDDDPLTTSDGADTMRGGTENDLMFGNADGDVMFGDSGDDTMYGDDDDPTTSGDGDDTMRGGIGQDLMFGNDGGDTMYGEADADRMIGGSSTAGEPDGPDIMDGGQGSDVMAGDNATIGNAALAKDKLVTLRLDGEGDGDVMHGGTEPDRMFGQTGDDEMYGDAGNDAMEGNAGNDEMHGNAGNDDMAGGGSSNDGVIDGDRVGNGLEDGRDRMWGDDGIDQMAGDNALIDRNFPTGAPQPLVLFDVNSADATVSGGDYMYGGALGDVMFGQGNGAQNPANADAPDGADNDLDGVVDEDGTIDMTMSWQGDAIFGESGADYVEGNHGADFVVGGGDDDDLVGGGSAIDGVIDGDRIGTGLYDGRDTILGNDGTDLIAGDNALMARNFDLGGAPATVRLFDVNSNVSAVSSGDYLDGGEGPDEMYGQGNGAQPATQTDPLDGADNDLDGIVDEVTDQPWLGDVMYGRGGPDVMEGNHGSDLMFGGDAADTMIGGGSANDGIIDADRVGNGLNDRGDIMYGEGDADRIAGDNARIDDGVPLVLFDVNGMSQYSGGDYLDGGGADDEMFGQGNGTQSVLESDPLDGLDTDGDGLTDEDQPWKGDVLFGRDGDDYMEGNHGADLMFAGSGEDDVIGGGSAIDGVIDDDRVGNGLNDRGDVMYGEAGIDFMAGDNARIGGDGDPTGLTLGADRSVLLFDVELVGDAADVTSFSGGDFMAGGTEADLMFGQGNGSQPGDAGDPLDGIDNDFDGRENPVAPDLGFDCLDAFDNDGTDGTDGADPGCSAAIDEDQPWMGDYMLGGEGDDYMEGNHGADWMFGQGDEDDIAGGGSAADGAIVPGRSGTDLRDGSDVIHGGDDDDVITGDNATVERTPDGGAWLRIVGSVYDLAVRTVTMATSPEPEGAFGNDYITGDDGDDDIYGQLGDDYIEGNGGEDAVVGDLGQITNTLEDGSREELIAVYGPFIEETIYAAGTLTRDALLFAFTEGDGGEGDDVVLGGDGVDTIHTGAGDDVVNGNGDDDKILTGDGSDAAWGGPGDDHLFGGWGPDYLDVKPRPEMDNGKKGAKQAIIPRDPPAWFTWGTPDNYQGFDIIYGGWDADAMQADVGGPGPVAGDRLVDWVGGYNAFYTCPAAYGEGVITRQESPGMREFMQALSDADGAVDTATEGTSGFRELGYVFPGQAKDNSNPPYPDHPAHFTCN